jgi:hypothetical protein
MSGFNLSVKLGMDPVKWILGANVTTSYVVLKDVASNPLILSPGRLLLIQNATDGDVMISVDGVTDHVPVFKGSFVLLDIMTNKAETGGAFNIAQQTKIYAIELNSAGGGAFAGLFTNPTTGAVFATVVNGQ